MSPNLRRCEHQRFHRFAQALPSLSQEICDETYAMSTGASAVYEGFAQWDEHLASMMQLMHLDPALTPLYRPTACPHLEPLLSAPVKPPRASPPTNSAAAESA